ncbi:hypothetical protein KDN24_13240 [Bacillus sp. Bva_UNVM-123]|uniref:hypothetical protein n=1 Tax=Bacillus sp. Bva_UNVM-123 TaxID=2829798 RepID=UPI00391F5F80
MAKYITKVLGLVSFTIFLLVFQSSFASAKDLLVVPIEKDDDIEELIISEDSIINAEEGVLIPKLIITNGATIVEINANVQILEVTAQNKVELIGNGNITDLIISTGTEVVVNTTGDIHKLEITNKDARLVVKEGSKISKLVIPVGVKRTDIITNYEHSSHRFDEEGIYGRESNDPTPPTYDNSTPPTYDNSTPPTDDNSTPPTDDNSTPPTDDNSTPPTDDNPTPPTVEVTEGSFFGKFNSGFYKYFIINKDDNTFKEIYYEMPGVQYKHFINGDSVDSTNFENRLQDLMFLERVSVEEGKEDDYNTINLIIP